MSEVLTVAEVCAELDELVASGVIDTYDEEAVEQSLQAAWVKESLDDATNCAIAVFSHLIDRGLVVEYDPEAIYGHSSYERLIEQYATASDGYLDGWTAELEGVVYEEDIDITLRVDGESVERTMTMASDWTDTHNLTGLMNDALDAVGAPGRFYVFSTVPAEFAALYLRPEQVRPAYWYFTRRMTDLEREFDPTPGNTAECVVCADPVDLGEAWPSRQFPDSGQPVHSDCYPETDPMYPVDVTELS